MSIYYKYAPDGTNIVVLSYVYKCVDCYTSEYLGKWFVETLGKILHVKFLGYAHWFISIRISPMKDHSISVEQAIYYTSTVSKYLDTATVKTSTKFFKTTFPYDMILTKTDASTIDEQVDKLPREFNIHYRACIGSLIYFVSTIVYLSFAVHKLEKLSSNFGGVNFEGLIHLLRYISCNNNLGLKYYTVMKYAPVYGQLRKNNIKNKN